MAVKKSELYSTLWASCDELRGGIEPSIYKDYVLLILFVRYVTDKAPFSNGQIVIPDGGGFQDLVALKNKPNIGEEINKAISKLASANQLEGIIDVADFNNDSVLGAGQLKVDKLSGLIGVFENPNLNFANNRADGDDILGDAYEYLMMKFSIESGKSKAQFYTPAEVSQIMSYLIGIDKATDGKQTIYDPTCGSGSLLLKAHDTALTNTGFDLAIYGQELADNTASLARMNMWLHNVTTSQINSGESTISKPHFTDKNNPNSLRTFDYVVANPPFSTSNWRSGFVPEQDVFGRFEGYGMPPDKNGDYAFLLHIIASLRSNGSGAVILPHGVLFRGNAEAVIRKSLIEKRLIKAIVGLPANLFYGTGIPACILVIDKEGSADRKHIFMIDASKGFTKNGNKNKLRDRDTHKILDVYKNELEIPKLSRKVPLSEISNSANDYNLNLPRYIDTSEAADIQSIEGHILGGIPEEDVNQLDSYWAEFPSLRNTLIKENARKGFVDLKVESKDVNSLINSNEEVEKFKKEVHKKLDEWVKLAQPVLEGVDEKCRPKILVDDLGEKILEIFQPVNLIDGYAIYQGVREYWDSTLKDDIYTIVELGWLGSSKPVKLAPKAKDRVDYQIKKEKYHSETLPSQILIERFFAKEASEIDSIEEQLTLAVEALDDFDAEFGGDEGVLREYLNDKGRIVKKDLAKLFRSVDLGQDEKDVLKKYEALAEAEEELKEKRKTKESELVELIAQKYSSLEESDVKSILIENKWIKAIKEVVENELDSTILKLSKRLSELNDRYLVPLPIIEKEREELSQKVEISISRLIGTQALTHSDAVQNIFKTYTLGDIISQINDGGTPSTNIKENFGGEIPWVVIDDIKSQIFDTKTHLSHQGLKNSSAILWPQGTLILSTGATIGEVGIAMVPMATKQGICGIIFNQELADTQFMRFWFTKNRKLLNALAQGSTIREIRPHILKSISLSIPSVKVQTEIAQVLLELESRQNAIQSELEKIKQVGLGMSDELLDGRRILL